MSFPKIIPDSNNDGFSDQNDFYSVFKDLNMNSHEIFEIFSIIDENNKGLINPEEWNSFRNLFIIPFELNCDLNRNLFLNEKDLKNCIQKLESFKLFFKGMEKVKDDLKYKKLMILFNSKFTLNFFDYLYLRRVAYAWQECSEKGEKISKEKVLSCAIQIMFSKKSISENEINYIISIAEDFSEKTMISSTNSADLELNLLGFINVMHKYYLFNEMVIRNVQEGLISKKDFISALEDGKLSMDKMNKSLIEKIFNDVKNNEKYFIDFKFFFIFMNTIDGILIHGKAKKGFLNEKEFLDLVDANFFNQIINNSIDDNTVDIDEKILIQIDKKIEDDQEVKIDEGSFFKPEKNSVFLQLQSLIKKKKIDIKSFKKKPKKNIKSRKIFFDIFDEHSSKFIDAVDIINLIKFAFIFDNISSDSFVTVENIKENIHSLTSPIPATLFDKNLIEKLTNFDENLPLNFLEFCGFMKYNKIFKNYSKKFEELQSTVILDDLKEGLKKLGLKIITKDLNKCSKGSLEVENKSFETYDYDRAFKLAIRNYSRYLVSKKDNIGDKF